MSRPRVLCVSSDRSTRASVTLSLTDEPVNVVVAQRASEAISRLEQESIDAVVIDATTVTEIPALIAAAESQTPKMPTFVHWGETDDSAAGDESYGDDDGEETDDTEGSGESEDTNGTSDSDHDSIAVLSQVVARTDEPSSSNRLADAITERLEIGIVSEAVVGRIVANAKTDAAAEGGARSVTGATPVPSVGADSAADPSSDSDATTDDDRDEPGSLPPDLEWSVDAVRRRLADATSPAVVERVLREEFMASDRFEFAWVGEYDRGEREVVPWLTDPSATEWPMQRTFSIGADDGTRSLLEQALHDRALRIVELADATTDADSVPFGTRATERNVQSVAAVPLATDDELYGVFVVYALRGFSDADRAALQSAADIASHVLETIAIRGQLEQQERVLQRYERLVETAGDGMYVFDEDGNFMTVNDALVEMTGYSREGLLGEHATFLFDEEDVAAGEEIIRSLLGSDRGTDTLELLLETKQGETIPCEIQIAVLMHDGEFHGSVGVVRDVTERKRQERKLRERNERLDAFARIVSHDLRNPLSVAQGYIDLIDQTGSTEHVPNVRDGLDRMETIIDDVLAIARGGEWAAETEPVDLESVAADAWEHVSTAEATLSVVDTMTLEADRSRLLRLLENCFRNSIEHGGSAVTIRIGTLEDVADTTAGASPGFYIADDGSGLPDEIRDEVFDPSVSSSSEGLGIGLWVVREVATGHGWTVTAGESDTGGARFEFVTDGSGQ